MNHQLTAVDVKHVKQQITACIKLYQRDFTQEANDFYAFVREKRAGLHNEGGTIEGDHAIERALFEMPVGLYGMLTQNLSPEEFVWFKTKEGARWFAKNFKNYALVEV